MSEKDLLTSMREEIARMPDAPDAGLRFECAVCEDTGMVVAERNGSRAARQCECRRRKGLAQRMRAAGIPARYAEAGFANFRTQGADLSVAKAALALRTAVAEFLLFPRGQGFLLTGTCGVGKTHLACAALRTAMERYGVRGRFWDMADLLTGIKASFSRKEPMARSGDFDETEDAIVQSFASVDVLVVDELGGERLTDWSDAEMRLLLNARYNAGGDSPKLTIFTTNFPNLGAGEGKGGAETLGDRIGSRMFSRLQEQCRHFAMQGADFRRKQR